MRTPIEDLLANVLHGEQRPLRPVGRAMTIVGFLMWCGMARSTKSITEGMGTNRTMARRLPLALIQMGWASKPPDTSLYRMGLRFLAMDHVVTHERNFLVEVRPRWSASPSSLGDRSASASSLDMKSCTSTRSIGVSGSASPPSSGVAPRVAEPVLGRRSRRPRQTRSWRITSGASRRTGWVICPTTAKSWPEKASASASATTGSTAKTIRPGYGSCAWQSSLAGIPRSWPSASPGYLPASRKSVFKELAPEPRVPDPVLRL